MATPSPRNPDRPSAPRLVGRHGTATRKAEIIGNPKTKPALLPITENNIPNELQTLNQWVVWRYCFKNGRWTKPPYQAKCPHSLARVNDPATWSTFEQALAVRRVGDADGIGIVLLGGAGIDLDDCVDADGEIARWAQEIITEADTYTEISPTGTGVKMYLRGSLPAGRRRKGHVEMYDDSSARYFTITGRHVPGAPSTVNDRQAQLASIHAKYLADAPTPALAQRPSPKPINLDDDALVRAARSARNGNKFGELWDGKLNGHASHSEADAALCCLLVWWTQHDGPRVDRLFRLSSLMRTKWDEQHSGDGRTYGQMTIESALAKISGDYSPGSSAKHIDVSPTDDQPRIMVVGAILSYMRTHLEPIFRRGDKIWSGRLNREMGRSEVCQAPTTSIIPALLVALDFPRDKHGPDRSKVPPIYRQWAPFAWADLLQSLPEEPDTAGEISGGSEEEFQGLVTAALMSIEGFAHTFQKKKDEKTEVQRRSLLDWCRLFAKPGPWQSVRSLSIWCRRGGGGEVQIALHQRLFGQIRRPMPHSHRKFAALCESYGIGIAGRTSRSAFVELAPAFLADLQAAPCDASEGPQ